MNDKRGRQMKISVFYEEKLGANLSNARWSWGATNPTTNQLFLRVWDDQLEVVDGVERISILKTDWEGSSAGFPERKRHVAALREDAEGYGVLCTAKDKHSVGSRTIKSFDEETLIRFGKVIEDGNHIYAEIAGRIPVEDLARNRTATSTLLPDIKSILNRRIEDTTKEALVNARVGQGLFRAQVLSNWNRQCCVTGSRTLDAIRASHIKPWRNSTNEERLDPNNGLPLIATLDALFDAGLISFADNGDALVSKRLDREETKILGINGKKLLRAPTPETVEYLAFHRSKIYLDGR